MADDDRAAESPGNVELEFIKRRCRIDHLLRDAGELNDALRDSAKRIDELLIVVDDLPAFEYSDADFGDAVVEPRRGTGGFDV
jgi:hypothetical protein